MRLCLLAIMMSCCTALHAQNKLTVPSSVAVHSLARVSADAQGEHYHLRVMTVTAGRIKFIRAVRTDAKKATWVFTGPPGVYAIELTVFNKDSGFQTEVGQVVIGERPSPTPPPPPPTPPSPPTPVPDDDFGVGKITESAAAEHCSPNFPRAALAEIYRDVAARLEGSKTPIVPTIERAFRSIIDSQEKLFGEQQKQEWSNVRTEINSVWNDNRHDIDRAAAVRFFRAVANGLALPPATTQRRYRRLLIRSR